MGKRSIEGLSVYFCAYEDARTVPSTDDLHTCDAASRSMRSTPDPKARTCSEDWCDRAALPLIMRIDTAL